MVYGLIRYKARVTKYPIGKENREKMAQLEAKSLPVDTSGDGNADALAVDMSGDGVRTHAWANLFTPEHGRVWPAGGQSTLRD